MMARIILIILVTMGFNITAFADVKLFLSSRHIITDESNQLFLCDIAKIDCGSEDPEQIKNIILPQNVYSDGYIDKNEISGILKNSLSGIFYIYGSAVKIDKADQKTATAVADGEIKLKSNDILVRKGQMVNLILLNKGILLELYGRVLQNGRCGDIVPVEMRLHNNSRPKPVRGRINSKGQIEVIL